MSKKFGLKFWLSVLIAFLLLQGIEMLLHGIFLDGLYKENPQGFLPKAMSDARMPWLFIGYLLLAFIWTYLFNRFVGKKDLISGLEFGLILMVFYRVPQSLIWYSLIPVTGYCHLYGLIGNLVEGVIIGAIMGTILKEKG
jgi:hypothetical protein